MKKRKLVLAIVTGMVMGIILTGCGDQESQSSATGQIPEEDQIEYFPEEIQDAIQEEIDNAEAEHEEMLEAEYPEGILPPGIYKLQNYQELEEAGMVYIKSFEARYNEENGLANIFVTCYKQTQSLALVFTNVWEYPDKYVYDMDTKQFHFEATRSGEFDEHGSEFIIEGYLTEDGNFCMTYFESNYLPSEASVSEDIEWIYTRE